MPNDNLNLNHNEKEMKIILQNNEYKSAIRKREIYICPAKKTKTK